VRYVEARLRQEDRANAYRIYVTDALKVLTENSAGMVSHGKAMSMRFIDIFNPPEERTGEDIIEMMKNKLRKAGGE